MNATRTLQLRTLTSCDIKQFSCNDVSVVWLDGSSLASSSAHSSLKVKCWLNNEVFINQFAVLIKMICHASFLRPWGDVIGLWASFDHPSALHLKDIQSETTRHLPNVNSHAFSQRAFFIFDTFSKCLLLSKSLHRLRQWRSKGSGPGGRGRHL